MKKRFWAGLFALLMAMTVLFSACTPAQGPEESKTESKSGTDDPDDNVRVKLTVGVPQNANVTSYDKNAFTEYLEEVANVDIEFVYFPSGSDDYIRQLTLMAAANQKMPDVLWGFTGMGVNQRNEFGQAGYFKDLTDLIEQYCPNYKAAFAKITDTHSKERVTNRMTAEDGAIYAMPMFMAMTVWDDLQNLLFINQEWLDTLHLETPKTPEELYKVLVAFRDEDPNGNGFADEIPIFGRTSGNYNILNWIINSYVYYNQTYDLNVTDGKLWAPYITDEYRQALIFLSKLREEGLLSDLSFSATAVEMKAMVTPATGVAQVGIWAGHPSVYANQESPILEQYVPYAGLGDETGKGGYVVLNPMGLYFPLIVTEDCQNVRAAMRFVDAFYLDETVTRQRHGEKDVDWEVVENGVLPTGGSGYVKVLNSNAFFKGDRTWCANGGGILTGENYLVTMESVKKYDDVLNNLAKRTYEEIIANLKKPAEVAEDLIYTADQYERRGEYRTPIHSYLSEATNLFVLGTKDPSDDAQWKEYLDKLDQLGLKEYIAIVQEAYDMQ